MSTSSDHPINHTNIDKALELFYYHIREVAEYQHIFRSNSNLSDESVDIT